MRQGRAFTLIEMIGVLAVLAIFALILFPVFVRQLDRAAADKEANDLQTLAQGLKQSILRTKSIPDQSGWYSMLATNLGMQTNDVVLNSRRLRRCYLIDPNFQVGTNNQGLPYQQTKAGSVLMNSGFVVPPLNCRLLLLSSISTALPNSVQSGAGLSASDFDALWNLPERSAPATWSGWSQQGDDLKIQRINLAPCFKRLVLNNNDPVGALGWYSIDSSPLVPVNGGGGRFEAFFLESTVLGLYEGANTNTPLANQTMVRDNSYFYERGTWLGTVIFGLQISGSEFALIASLFLESPWNINSLTGTKQTDVVNAMINYMKAYEAWADAGFPGNGNQLYANVVSTRATVISYDVNLENNPAATNCP